MTVIRRWWMALNKNVLAFTFGCSIAALVALGVALRGHFFTYVGALFVVVTVVFHVGSEIVTLLAPEHDSYRVLIAQDKMGDWLLWVGPAILLLVLSYLSVLGRARLRPVDRNSTVARFFDWRWCLLATAPIYLIAVRGEGFVSGTHSEGGAYVTAGVTEQFLLLGVVLTAFAMTLRFRRFTLVLLGQSVALLLLGQRATVVGGIAVLCFLLARQHLAPTWRQAMVLGMIGVVGSLALSSARHAVGRAEFAENSGPTQRVAALVTGARELVSGAERSEITRDFVYRIDGNIFPALVLDAQRLGYAPADLAHLQVAMDVAIPSFVNPGKKARPETERDEGAYLVSHYGLAGNIDFMPTFFGSGLGIGGTSSFMLFVVLLGAGLGGIDRWLRRASPARTVVAAGLIACVVRYPRGFQIVPVTMRGALTIAAVVAGLHLMSRFLRRTRRSRNDPVEMTSGIHRGVIGRGGGIGVLPLRPSNLD